MLLTIFAKMLHHRFLVVFLGTSVGNTVKKNRHFPKAFPQLHKTLCFFIFLAWVSVGGHHNFMIPNIKTYFDKKVTFLALVPVLQWNIHPNFLIYLHSK